MHGQIQAQLELHNNIRRSVMVALDHLKPHVRNLDGKLSDAKEWASGIERMQQQALEEWEESLKRLRQLPAHRDFLFLTQQRPSTPKVSEKAGTKSKMTLVDFVDVKDVQKAGVQGVELSARFSDNFDALRQDVESLSSNAQDFMAEVQNDSKMTSSQKVEEADQLLEEVETLAKKIVSDYEHILSLPSNSKTLSSVSRMALGHTKQLLPSLTGASIEVGQALQQAVEDRHTLARKAVTQIQSLSSIESTLPDALANISELGIGADAIEVFDILDMVVRLPFAYGSTLIEAARRREWNNKMRTDSSALAEDMAVFKQEEQHRRKKWLKNMEGFLNPGWDDTNAMGIEVNLQSEAHEWPSTSRQDVLSYLESLRAVKGTESLVEDLFRALKELDAPTKHQARRAKAFKQGSMYDNTFGRNSLLNRGDNEMVQSLRDEKAKMEEKLKGSESRVRKLEDLLHRQGHGSRPLSMNAFGISNISDFDRQSPNIDQTSGLPSPRVQDLQTRRSSVSSRRASVNHYAADAAQAESDMVDAQKVSALETQLAAARERILQLEQDAQQDHDSGKVQEHKLEEAESTKKDLMHNLEAQQREFEDERRLLNEESKQLRLKIEEIEDDMDKLANSRDNERSGSEDRIVELETLLEKAKAEVAEKAQENQGQLESIRKDYIMQAERADALGNQVKRLEEERSSYQKSTQRQRQDQQAAQHDYVLALQAAYLQFSPNGAAPKDMGHLVTAIEMVAEGAAIHARGLEENIAMAQAENKALEERIHQAEAATDEVQERLAATERAALTARESLAEANATIDSLRSELEDERAQLKSLRQMFAAGETGSDSLKQRIAEEERNFSAVSEKLALAESHSKSITDELEKSRQTVSEVMQAEQRLRSRLEIRGQRAKDLSERLYTHNDRLTRTLEQLGFAIGQQDDSMVIQRLSKVAGTSTTLPDGSSAMVRTSSGPLPSRKQSETPEAMETIYWMHTEDADAEDGRYLRFIESISSFDVNMFCEAIIKRVRDCEHLARKWQKDSRAYRDKSHRAQSEAHEKIAFRSFKEGDLALFLPTRNQATRPWAAFNVGAPHYFLREQDSHKLQSRDWLLARISKVEERVVDLSKSISGINPDRRSIGETSDGGALDDENPFELSDGLRWYLLDAAEEKPGAPSTPGLGKSTVASANVDAKGSIRVKSSAQGNSGATKTLTKSLDTRRSSSNSKRSVASNTATPAPNAAASGEQSRASTSAGNRPIPSGLQPQEQYHARDITSASQERLQDEVRKDLLFGP